MSLFPVNLSSCFAEAIVLLGCIDLFNGSVVKDAKRHYTVPMP